MSETDESKKWSEIRESGMNGEGALGIGSVGGGVGYGGDGSTQQVAPYRWTLCPEWEQTGRCKYNEMCYRRHGPEDCRLVPQGWEKKRSMRTSSTSSAPLVSHSGLSALAGTYSNGNGPSQWSPSSSARPVLSSPSKGAPASSTHSQPIHTQYQTMSPTYSHYPHAGQIGSPDSYDSDLATSPTVLSPTILSPLITSPTLSHRMSLSSSPRDAYEHPQMHPIAEKPWIWQPCRHWQDSGTCRYGDSCKYRHGPEDRRERPAPRPAAHTAPHLMRSTSNSSMESLSTFSTNDSHATGRPNITLQPIGAQITSPNASMGSLPPFQSSGSANTSAYPTTGATQGSVIWDLFAPSTVGRLSPQLGENSTAIVQTFSEQLRNLSAHHPDSSEFQSELNSIHIQSMIAIQLQRENFLPISVQDPMRVLLQSIAISSNSHEWQFALIRVLDFLNALLDHLFNKFVSVSISSPSSSFGQLPVDIPSKLSLIQPYIGGRLSGSISELYDLGQRASAGIFAPTQEEVITILEQLRRVAASTSKSV